MTAEVITALLSTNPQRTLRALSLLVVHKKRQEDALDSGRCAMRHLPETVARDEGSKARRRRLRLRPQRWRLQPRPWMMCGRSSQHVMLRSCRLSRRARPRSL